MNSVQLIKLKNFFTLIILFCGLLFSIGCVQNNNNSNWICVTASIIIDGDTFDDDKNNRYRLFGVDTPEISHDQMFNTEDEILREQYGQLAKQEVAKLILNKEIQIQKQSVDKYSRIVSKWKINDVDIGLYLIQHGFGKYAYISLSENDMYYTNDFEYYSELLLKQKFAFDHKKVIWENDSIIKRIY